MSAALTFTLAARPAAFTSQQQRGARRGGRRLQRCLAMAAEEEKNLDFTNNKNAALGFTESDSAGQTNIFAVEPKAYVAGGSDDKTASGGQTTLIIAAVLASAAAAAVATGLVANSSVPDSLAAVAPAEGVKSLSAYSQQFAAESAPAARD